MRRGQVVLDGELMPLERACVPVDDLGLLRGWTVFDTLLVEEDGRFDRRHVDRLAQSCALGGIAFPGNGVVEDEIRRAAAALGEACSVRVTLTGSGRRIVAATPLQPGRRGGPVRCVTHPWSSLGVPPVVKHGSRMAWMLMVAQSGVDEVLLVDEDGGFVEGTTSAVVGVKGGVLRVAAEDDPRLLPSTTVERLLRRARAEGLPFERRALGVDEPVDALYLASSLRGLAPVVELDGVARPGWDPVGKALTR